MGRQRRWESPAKYLKMVRTGISGLAASALRGGAWGLSAHHGRLPCPPLPPPRRDPQRHLDLPRHTPPPADTGSTLAVMPRRAFGQAASGAGIILMGTWHHEQDSRPGQSEMDYNHVIHRAGDIIRT